MKTFAFLNITNIIIAHFERRMQYLPFRFNKLCFLYIEYMNYYYKGIL